MTAINALLGRIVDLFLGLFSGLPAWIGIAAATFIITLIAMPIIKWTLNPSLSDRMKRNLQGAILELRLFNDSLRATFRAIVDMLRWAGGYLGAWLLPILIMAVPMLPLFSHLHAHYGYKGLDLNESVVLTAKVAETLDGKPAAQLTAPAGIEVETPALWVGRRDEVLWRLRPTEVGDHQVTVSINGEEAVKQLTVADGTVRRSPVRPGNFLGQLLYPSEAPLSGNIREISVPYPETPVFMLLPKWVWLLLLFSIPFALILKKPFKVEF